MARIVKKKYVGSDSPPESGHEDVYLEGAEAYAAGTPEQIAAQWIEKAETFGEDTYEKMVVRMRLADKTGAIRFTEVDSKGVAMLVCFKTLAVVCDPLHPKNRWSSAVAWAKHEGGTRLHLVTTISPDVKDYWEKNLHPPADMQFVDKAMLRRLFSGMASSIRRRQWGPKAPMVPEEFASLPLSELPAGSLDEKLREQGVTEAGDLDLLHTGSLTRMEVVKLRNLIGRIASWGSAKPGMSAATATAFAVQTIDAAMRDLDGKTADILRTRCIESSGSFPSLEDIGERFPSDKGKPVSKQRIQQRIDKALRHIRTWENPRFMAAVSTIIDECEKTVAPLTVGRLAGWLKDEGLMPKMHQAFYVIVLWMIEPTIPAWASLPRVHGTRDKTVGAVGRGLRDMMDGEANPMPTAEAWKRIRQHLPEATLADFFMAIRDAGERYKVGGTETEKWTIEKSWLSSRLGAQMVLEESDRPLTANEINERGLLKHGERWAGLDGRSLVNMLSNDHMFFLLGSGTFGLEKHVHLSKQRWGEARDEFFKYLSGRKGSATTAAFLKAHKPDWAGRRSEYELSQIVKRDSRFAPGKVKFLFDLASRAKPGAKHRSIADIVIAVLEEAGTALNGKALYERVNAQRTLPRSSLDNAMRKLRDRVAKGPDGYYLLQARRL